MAAMAYIGGRDPVAPGVGDRPLSPVVGATGPFHFFFGHGPRCKFQKKFTLGSCRPGYGRQDPCRPMGGRPGVVLIFSKMDIYF